MDVSEFYEKHGWKREDENEEYLDARLNENLSKSASEYVSKIRLKIRENLPREGEKILDVGSGPIQYPEYEKISSGFSERHCVDLSIRALQEAKKKLANHVITHNIDFLDFDSKTLFDAVVAVNCLYHVSDSDQEKFVRKMIGVTSAGGTIIIVYSNPNSISARITNMIVSVRNIFLNVMKNEIPKNPIIFIRKDKKFWNRFKDDCEVEIKPWRTLNPALEKGFIPDNYFGIIAFRILYFLEKFKWWAYVSEYYLVRMVKREFRDDL